MFESGGAGVVGPSGECLRVLFESNKSIVLFDGFDSFEEETIVEKA